MKKLLSILLLGLGIFPVLSFAQSTTVTGTIVDGTGTTWANATITASFVRSQQSSDPSVWTGGVLNQNPATVSANGSGVFSISLPSNSAITPVTNNWQFVVCPISSLPCTTLQLYITGGSMNISTSITNSIVTSNIIPFNLPRVDNTNQVAIPIIGSLVYDLSASSLKVWNGSSWVATGGSGGATFPNTNGIVYNTSTTASQNATSAQIVSALNSSPTTLISPYVLPNSQSNAAGLAMVFDDSYAVNGATRYERSYAGLLRRDVLTLNPGYFQDWSVSGTTMPTIAASVLANWTPSQTVRSFASLGGGENDYTGCPAATTACIANFSQSASAGLAWLAIPPQYRILGTQFGGSGCSPNNSLSPINTVTGTVSGSGISCTTSASTQTFTIPSTNNGWFGLIYYVSTTGGGNFTISSIQNGTTTNFTNPATGTTTFSTTGYGGTAPPNNGPQRLQFTLTPGVAASITITQIGTTANTYISADYIPSGTLPAATNIVVARNAGAGYDIGGSYSAAMLTTANSLRTAGLTTITPIDYRAALLALPDGGISTTTTATYIGSTQANHPRDGAHLVGEQLALTSLLASGFNVANINWSTGTSSQETFDQWRWHAPKGHNITWTTYFHDFNLDSGSSPNLGICLFTCTGADAAGIKTGVDTFPGSSGSKGYLGFWGGNGAGLGNVTGFCPAIGYTAYNTLTEANFLKKACFDFATGKLTTVGAIVSTPETITFSATPTFSADSGMTRIILTGNVTSSTLAAGADGAEKTFQICQDSIGSRTFVWPINVKGGMTIGSTLSTCSMQTFKYSTASGYTNWYATSPGVVNQ